MGRVPARHRVSKNLGWWIERPEGFHFLEGDCSESPKLWVGPSFVDAHVHLGLCVEKTRYHSLLSIPQSLWPDALVNTRDNSGWRLGREAHFDAAFAAMSQDTFEERFGCEPLFIEGRDCHWGLANRKARAYAKLPPADGVLLRDPELGRLKDGLPALNDDVWMRGFDTVQNEFLSQGIYKVCEIATDRRLLERLKMVKDQNRIKLELECYAYGLEVEEILRIRNADDLPIVGRKLFLDGALESRGAAISKNYTGTQGCGELYFEDGALREEFKSTTDAGLELALHTIGDRAVHQALNVWEPFSGKLGLRLEHLQLCRPEDVVRMPELGVRASIQPIHFESDRTFYKNHLPQKLWPVAYPWASFENSNVSVLMGSDAPIASISPEQNIRIAGERLGPGDTYSLSERFAAESYTEEAPKHFYLESEERFGPYTKRRCSTLPEQGRGI